VEIACFPTELLEVSNTQC